VRAARSFAFFLAVELHHQLERTERALREREVTFAALAKVAPVGIMRFDSHGRCNYVNDRWREISGLTIDQAIGDGWQRVVHPDDLPHVVDRWTRLRLQENIFREEYRLCKPDGTFRWVMAEGVPVRSYSGRLLGFIRAVTDITTHRELEVQLRTARAELEERVRERTADLEMEMRERQKLEKQVLEARDDEQRRFSGDLHDGLGQYLTGILFRAVALQRDLEREHSKYAPDITKIAELVNETINQTHQLARGIHPVPLRPDGLVLALAELQQAVCGKGAPECSYEHDGAVLFNDATVATHVYRIAQEALTNAVKYSRASKINMRLRRDHDAAAELVVRDNGSGFKPDQRRLEGRGLGIMKHRARLIDGVLEVATRPGHGTTIRCRFPLPSANHHEQA
jgi:PAS domain S-box-containing protein